MAWARGAAAGEWVAARVIVAEGDCVTGGVDGDADVDGFVVGGVDGAPDVDGCGEDPCIDCCVAGCEDDVLAVGGCVVGGEVRAWVVAAGTKEKNIIQLKSFSICISHRSHILA